MDRFGIDSHKINYHVTRVHDWLNKFSARLCEIYIKVLKNVSYYKNLNLGVQSPNFEDIPDHTKRV